MLNVYLQWLHVVQYIQRRVLRAVLNYTGTDLSESDNNWYSHPQRLWLALLFLQIGGQQVKKATLDLFEVLKNNLNVDILGLEASYLYSISGNTCFGSARDTYTVVVSHYYTAVNCSGNNIN